MRTLFVVLALLTALPATAQDRVDPNRLDGIWRLDFALDPASGETAVGRIALKALSGIMDEVEIRFAFETDARLHVMVDAFGEKDEEWSEWHIAPDGYLVLGENEHFNAEDTVWYFEDDRLVAYELDDDGKATEQKGMALERLGT